MERNSPSERLKSRISGYGRAFLSRIAMLGEGGKMMGESFGAALRPIEPKYRLSERDYRATLAEMDQMDIESTEKDWQDTGDDLRNVMKQLPQKEE